MDLKEFKEYRYIAIEGNIGVGKTTLAKLLAKQLNARLVLEEFADNPFLEKFYEDQKRYAFPVEMAFLADRYRQLQALENTQDLFQPILVADYAPFKSLLFAQNNLEEQEFLLYRNFWELSLGKLPSPDLIIYLKRPMESLQRNIVERGRSYEQSLPLEYLQTLEKRYKYYLEHSWNGPIQEVFADDYDFLAGPDVLNTFLNDLLKKK